MVVQLPAGYHLTNFLTLIRFVRNQYADLLLPEEAAYCDDFEALSTQAQSLYVRLILRKGPVFRSDKIRYEDIENISATADELSKCGFLNSQVEETELVALLTKADLVSCLPSVPGLTQLRREDLVGKVVSEIDLLNYHFGFDVLRPLRDEVLLLYRLLFFGNLAQDFTEFVLTDMGMLRYEDYEISHDVRMFDSRELIDKTWQVFALREICDEMVAAGEYDGLADLITNDPVLGPADSEASSSFMRRRDHLFVHVARHLERQQLIQEALSIYRLTSLPPARERCVRILTKEGELPEALALCEEMYANPLDESELEVAARLGNQLAKKQGLTCSIPQSQLVYESEHFEVDENTGREIGVEESVRICLEQEGSQCFYVENNLIPGLFGLCFWDIIFKPIKGEFINPFQRGPRDLFTPTFQPTRKLLIEQRFEKLADREWTNSKIRKTYSEKFATANFFVNWNVLTPELMELALRHIPLDHLLVMFSRMIFDLRKNRSGFPDLIAFRQEKSTDYSYEMVEVKGPNDQLQLNQKRWIKTFTAAGIPFKLAKLSWVNS
jgi:hypothetical protein